MATDAVSSTGSSSTVEFVDPAETGFNALGAEDFMKLLIVELQNQDPTEPVKNEDLLSQLSAMQALNSNTELQDTLEKITAVQIALAESQYLTNAANLIGKSITSETYDGTPVEGVVDRAFQGEDGEIYVGVGEYDVPLAKVHQIDLAA